MKRVAGVVRVVPAVLLLVVLLAACGGGPGEPGPTPAGGDAPLVLAAGGELLKPAGAAGWTQGIDLERLGIGAVQAVYDVTTPAMEPFAFDAVSRGAANTGDVRLGVAHAAEGGLVPVGGVASIANVGVVVSGPGQATNDPFLVARGDGFARMTFQGRVDAEQVFAVVADADGEQTCALVRVRVGAPSVINVAAAGGSDHPGVVLEQTLYSSDSWMFGLPTIGVSGDRTTVVCYEGDRGDPFRSERYELRLQHDARSGAVTGGAVSESSPDRGNWRDHEIAALYNVLAILRGGSSEVELALSFDRGATIAQTIGLGASPGAFRPRLVQAAIALDYRLAVLFWRPAADGRTELALVEGAPDAYDTGGSPTSYAFEPAQVLHRATGDVTPALMGATWSGGGDLVVGYAYTSFRTGADRTWTSTTRNRCYTRRFGEAAIDTLVEESVLVGKDPSVAVAGQGDTLRIYYAYESPGGVRLVTSEDGGATFGAPHEVGDASSHMPTVIARDPASVDLLFLTQAAEGLEFHVRHWDDFDVSAPVDHRLTRAVTEGLDAPPLPGPAILPPFPAPRITQVAWLGYDAVQDGEEIVVVYHEETLDGLIALPGIDFIGAPMPAAGGAGVPDAFEPALPPPLAPGLTEPVPPPDDDHRGRLVLLRLH